MRSTWSRRPRRRQRYCIIESGEREEKSGAREKEKRERGEGERMKTTLRMPLDGIDGWRTDRTAPLPL